MLLRDWVPGATTIIVVSGIAEIVLGLVLVAARRSAHIVGLAAAVLLVRVLGKRRRAAAVASAARMLRCGYSVQRSSGSGPWSS